MLSRRALALATFVRSTNRTAQLSTSSRPLQKLYESSVQTPLQSQNKDSVVSPAARPEADAQTLETPVQRQRREALVPPPGRPDPGGRRAVWGLMLGIIVVPPVTYYYYKYRREHMDNKRANLIEQQRQKYANGG